MKQLLIGVATAAVLLITGATLEANVNKDVDVYVCATDDGSVVGADVNTGDCPDGSERTPLGEAP